LSNTIYVDAIAPGLNNGSSWANAYTSLQSALGVAIAGTAIEVGQGTYSPGTAATATFQLVNGVSIDGGYAGYGTSNPDDRNVSSYVTTLTGGGTISSVVTGSGTNSTAVLDGMTITGGTGLNMNGGGGGILDISGSPSINDCVFTANAAINEGAAMFNSSSSPTVSNCSFIDNEIPQGGGAGGAIVSGDNSAPTLINCIFSGNSDPGGYGGAMANFDCSPQLTDCLFIGNSAGAGGAIYDQGPQAGLTSATGADPTITNCTFSENTSNTALGGGAIFNYFAAFPTVTNCILWGDLAPQGSAADVEVFNYRALPPSTTVGITYSDIQGVMGGVGNIDADPLFVDSAAGNFQIQPTSPAVDAGDDAAVPPGVTTDLADDNRFQEVPTSNHAGAGAVPIVDMGAYEAEGALSAVAGGPYFVAQGQNITLSGGGFSNVAGPLHFLWTIGSGDSVAQLSGPDPVFSSVGFTAGTVAATLQVTDAGGGQVTSTTTITIEPLVYVDDLATGADNGTTWNDAYTNLQQALNAAVPNETIEVAQGTYAPGPGATATFQLLNNVSILGGYAGFGDSDPDARNVTAYPTILWGAGTCYHVVTGSGTNSTAVLDGFTVTGGNAGISDGGGLLNVGGNPTINDCAFISNSANSGYGGGICNSSSSPTVTNCSFIGNSAGNGGGMANLGTSAPIVTDCLFIDNVAKGDGGGMYFAGYGTVTNCTFSGNTATDNGGAIKGGGKAAAETVTNCILWGDNATQGGNEVFFSLQTDVSFSDVEGGNQGTGNINADPLFISSTDLELQQGSPCINAGSNAAVPAGVITDLAGYPRIVGGTVDMGAYEAPLYATPAFGGVTVNDHATVVTIKEGQRLDLDPITYDGPPPGPVPSYYDGTFPRFPQ
jgi:predicted outer membrane repeat protein